MAGESFGGVGDARKFAVRGRRERPPAHTWTVSPSEGEGHVTFQTQEEDKRLDTRGASGEGRPAGEGQAESSRWSPREGAAAESNCRHPEVKTPGPLLRGRLVHGVHVGFSVKDTFSQTWTTVAFTWS